MPVSIVIGGQFGGEGKGKVALEIARRKKASLVVRVGGTNSGHTVIDSGGATRKFRALPTAAILSNTICVIAPGSYVDASILLKEIGETNLGPDRVIIDPRAVLITDTHKRQEIEQGLRPSIGSTLSGTGAAVVARLLRDGATVFARSDKRLIPYIRDTRPFLRECLKRGERVVIEGTQGFGLSVLHADDYPYVTSRDTSAASFVSEAGLSPTDVDEVVMVLRAFPIRVLGNSGPLPNEIDWATITKQSGYREGIVEYTTVTNSVRRVARFHPDVVRAAIDVNAPDSIVLNHLDYIDAGCRQSHVHSELTQRFVADVEEQIGASVDYVGFGPSTMIEHQNFTPAEMSA